jgi:hypothetical protein
VLHHTQNDQAAKPLFTNKEKREAACKTLKLLTRPAAKVNRERF